MRAIPKSVKCPKCHKKFNAIIGDVLPFYITCIKCGFKWRYDEDDRFIFPFKDEKADGNNQ